LRGDSDRRHLHRHQQCLSDHGEPTIAGLAVGLAVTGRIPDEIAFIDNKRIDVSINKRIMGA
jgi:hypothetical protein